MKAPRFLLAATHSGAGKTSWTLGLLSAFRARGVDVRPFKAGPDYIDPALHAAVCGLPSRNLDARLMGPGAVRRLFAGNGAGGGLSLIEGVMGYYDGASGRRRTGSSAELARLLRCPVVLVLDATGAGDSVAAVAHGFLTYSRPCMIRAFLLNRVGSASHAAMVRSAVERKTKLPVLGYRPKDGSSVLPERHLGLLDPSEVPVFRDAVRRLAEAVERDTDMDALLGIARSAPDLPEPRGGARSVPPLPAVRIAVARDAAFRFYYEDNLDILRDLGAAIVPFSPLEDRGLPEGIGGAYFGGGYPELYAQRLADNVPMRTAVRGAVRAGLPVFAECGGYMYLLDEIEGTDGKRTPMAGAFRGRAVMGRSLAALGYYDGEILRTGILGPRGRKITGHAFHWSHVTGLEEGVPRAFLLSRPTGAPVEDGVCTDSALASYLHVHFASCPSAARRFVARCRRYAAGNVAGGE